MAKRIISFVLPLFISLCLAAIASEIYLRKTSSYITEQNNDKVRSTPFIRHDPSMLIQQTTRGKRLVPNAHVMIHTHYGSGMDVMMDINSLGFRDDEIPIEKSENEIRIIFLGDSIVLSDFLPKDQIFVELIEKELNNHYIDKNIAVINTGVTDIGIKEELDILTENVLRLDADYVILGFYLNDSRPPWGFTGELDAPGWLRSHSLLIDMLYKKFKLAQFLKEKGVERASWKQSFDKLNWSNDRNDFLKWAKKAKYDWGAAWEHESWDTVDIQLQRLKLLSIEHNFKVAVVVFPVAYQVYTNFIENTPQTILKEKVKRLKFEYFDILPVLRPFRAKFKMFYDQCHPTDKTHKIIAEALTKFIKVKLLREITN